MTQPSTLQHKIRHYLESHNLPIAAFERQAGLKINVARNILRGTSKHPTNETLQALAKAMGCPMHDLFPDRAEALGPPHTIDPDLMTAVFQGIIQQSAGQSMTFKQLFHMLEEAYTYTLEVHTHTPDPTFIRWLVRKTL